MLSYIGQSNNAAQMSSSHKILLMNHIGEISYLQKAAEEGAKKLHKGKIICLDFIIASFTKKAPLSAPTASLPPNSNDAPIQLCLMFFADGLSSLR
jgi:hypothetical protein